MALPGFVTVEHPQFGRVQVPPSRVPHMAKGWKVVDPADDPKPRPGVEAEDPPAQQNTTTPAPDGDGAEPPEEK